MKWLAIVAVLAVLAALFAARAARSGELPEVGKPAPDFSLPDQNGKLHVLKDYRGKWLVLYFYPRDDTPGCTREAQDFSALQADFAALGCALLGISRDTPAKHRKFIDKYDLVVPLASDDSGAATDAFGTWIEKQLYGKIYMGMY